MAYNAISIFKVDPYLCNRLESSWHHIFEVVASNHSHDRPSQRVNNQLPAFKNEFVDLYKSASYFKQQAFPIEESHVKS